LTVHRTPPPALVLDTQEHHPTEGNGVHRSKSSIEGENDEKRLRTRTKKNDKKKRKKNDREKDKQDGEKRKGNYGGEKEIRESEKSFLLQVLSQHLPGGSEENHEKPQSAYSVSGSRFESGTSPIRSRGTNHSATTFDEKHRNGRR
jgi:hypothetical protein